jgi:hypothetical protein
MCSITYSTPSIISLCLLVSSTINFISCCEFSILILQLPHLEYLVFLLNFLFLFHFSLCFSTTFNIFHFLYWIKWFWTIWITIYKGWKSFIEST